jgi:hypothetical protein
LFVVAVIAAAVVRVGPVRAETAADDKVAVVAIEVRGDADPQLREQVETGIALGVDRAGVALVAFDEVQAALASKPALQGCVTITCLASIGELVDAQRFVAVTVSANGANYDVEVTLLGADGEPRKRAGTCTVCTITDLAELVSAKTYDLITSTAGAPIAVTIDSRPRGATLVIPGVGNQPAPWSGALPAGTHVIEARKAGHATARQEIELADDGSEHSYELLLAPLDDAEVAPWRKPARWALTGTAAASLITGVVLLVMDGNPTCDVDEVTCPEVYDTGGAGIGFSLLGVAAGAGAGWLFYLD